jgi:probable O-glycosylation ligase (exosortase A-associated)
LVDDRKKYRTVLLVIGLSLGFECAKQGWVSLYRAPGAKNDNPIVFLGDNNGVALGTMMLVPILGALAQTAVRRWEKYSLRFLAIGVLLRGLTTYSRGGFLAAGVVGIFTFVRSEKKIRAVVGVLAVCILVGSVMPQTFWDRMQTITAPDDQLDVSAAGRLHFWAVAGQMASAKPLTGVGLNGYLQSYETYNVTQDFGGVRAAHSAWFGVLGDLGYPGLILFLANFGLAVWSCWRVNRTVGRDPAKRELRLYANALLTSLAAYAVGATFLSYQYNEMFWHLIGLSTALYIVTMSEESVAEAVVATAPFQAPRQTTRVRSRDHDAAAVI